MAIREKFENHGGDRFAREVAHFVECLLLSRLCHTGFFAFLGAKGTRLDSVFDGKSEYINFKKLQ